MARILVVDDDPDILKMAEGVLASVGHTVFVAEDAMRAMDWLNAIDFDLLISDANMPLYSGFELINTVRNNPRFSQLSVAMLTGLRERKDIEKAVKVGVDDYIVKPIDPMLFVQKVASLFEKRPPQDYPEIKLGGTPLGAGTVRMKMSVETVSEIGVRIRTDFALKTGSMLDLEADFFKGIESPVPPMKILTCDLDTETNTYVSHLIFLGAREAFLQQIRKWLYSHGASARGIQN